MAQPGDPIVTLSLRISGRVQGVGYRYWAVGTALRLALIGWVRNLTDGSVEALVQGKPEVVETFLAACREGPPGAKVISVEVNSGSKPFEGLGFEQRATASPLS
tara:strand:+ start:561 stop:872 length:312 start_codon:yes stop_codon:yes gene_type:complete